MFSLVAAEGFIFLGVLMFSYLLLCVLEHPQPSGGFELLGFVVCIQLCQANLAWLDSFSSVMSNFVGTGFTSAPL